MMNKTIILAAGLLLGTIPTLNAQLLTEIGFETSEGYTLNANLNNLNSWTVPQGSATVSNLRSGAVGASGAQHVNQQSNSIIRYENLSTDADIVLVRGKWYGTGSATLSVPNTTSPIAALIGFRSVNASTFTIDAYDGTADTFVPSGVNFPNTQWHDIDILINYTTQRFSVRANGNPILLSIPFQSSVSELNGFESHAENSSNTDRLQFFASDGDLDGDGVPDEVEFANPNRNPFVADGSPTLDLAYTAPPIENDVDVPDLTVPQGGETWHRISLAECENISISADFIHSATNNIQLQLFDSRCRQQGQPLSVFEYRVGESFTTTNQEFITFANNRGVTELFLRVYEESGNEGNYNLRIDRLGSDDGFEFNSSINLPAPLAIGSYQNLVAKDDDFYLIDVEGIENLQISLTHNFGLGQLFFQVFDDSGTFNGFIDGAFTTNENTISRTINVSGRDQVVLRVYNANLGANFYDLSISSFGSSVASEDFAPGLDTDNLGSNFFPEEMLSPAVEKPTVVKGGDDSFEPNNSIEAVLNATPIPVNQTISAVMLDGEDWYKVPLTTCENMVFDLGFSHAAGDLNLEVYDGRCTTFGVGTTYRVASSYSTTDNESTIYVNNSGNDFIYVRVYGEAGASNPSYTLRATGIGQDDIYEVGSTPSGPAAFPLNTLQENLISKDDDFFLLDVTGINTINVSLDHDRFLGQLFLQVLNNDGTYNEYRDSQNRAYNNFSFNVGNLVINDIDVSGVNFVVLRVYAANRGTNVYDLQVNTVN